MKRVRRPTAKALEAEEAANTPQDSASVAELPARDIAEESVRNAPHVAAASSEPAFPLAELPGDLVTLVLSRLSQPDQLRVSQVRHMSCVMRFCGAHLHERHCHAFGLSPLSWRLACRRCLPASHRHAKSASKQCARSMAGGQRAGPGARKLRTRRFPGVLCTSTCATTMKRVFLTRTDVKAASRTPAIDPQ